ncbi:MAG TPA: alpha-glucosidase, partial [Ruminococcaceae bacterium]|nr:alpha-glucosidase [Oscillospiraceae bacterium]
EASYQAQRAKNPALRPFLSSRGSNMAIRRLAQTWSGDNRTEFSDLRYCNYIGLTMSMSGLEFYGHDLGGFTGNMPSRELLLRWLQLGLFQPRFTIHSWNKDGSATMPWSYPDIMPSVKALFSQRKQLLPYMYNCAYRAVCEDLPINAPLCLYYDDENINDDCDSFMFGRDILVTCVFDEGKNEAEVYLPTGDSWYVGGRLYEGGNKVKLSITPYDKMPYAVRAGSIIPTDEGKAGFEGDEKLVFTVYPLKDGCFEAEFFDDDGVSYSYLENDCVKLAFTVECNGSKVIVSYKNKGNKKITPEIRLAKEDSRELVVI